MPRKAIPPLPVELPAFDHVEPGDLPRVRSGWAIAHRAPAKAAAIINAGRPDLAMQAIGARAALTARGRCLRCGRVLQDPISVARGVGPDCWAKGYRPPAAGR